MSDQKHKRQNSVNSRANLPMSTVTGVVSGGGPGGGAACAQTEVFLTKERSKSRDARTNSSSKSMKISGSGYDQVRQIVEEEGRSARNLVTWNVPLEIAEQKSYEQITKTSSTVSPVFSRRQLNSDPDEHKRQCGRAQQADGRNHGRISEFPSSAGHGRGGARQWGRGGGATGGGGARQWGRVGGVRTTGTVKRDVRARYWAFLFENLERAVDEIYQTCETDESVVECKEVIMMLDCCTKDFKSLIDRLQLLEAYEKNAEEGNRPVSLAWEVRKSSPGKSLSNKDVGGPRSGARSRDGGATRSGGGIVLKDPPRGGAPPSSTAIRSLTFSETTGSKSDASTSRSSGNSWADRVKGVRSPASSQEFTQNPLADPIVVANVKLTESGESQLVPLHVVISGDEGDGWETVQRANKSRNSARPGSGTVEERVKRLSTGSDRDNGGLAEFKRSVSAIAVNSATDVSSKNVCRTAQSLSNVSHGLNDNEGGNTVGTLHKNINVNSSGSLTNVRRVHSDGKGEGGSLEGSDKENLERAGCATELECNEELIADKEIKLLRRSLGDQNSSRLMNKKFMAVFDDEKVSSGSSNIRVQFEQEISERGPVRKDEDSYADNDYHFNNDDDNYDDSDDNEIDNALRTVMDEEASLELHLLELEQQEAIESANIEEQTYLLEIERQRSQELLLVDDADLDEEEVSHMLKNNFDQCLRNIEEFK